MPFLDRTHAGRALGDRLKDIGYASPVVLALPKGGVIVGAEVARILAAPLDILVVRKLRAPGEPELALGAIGEDGVPVINEELLAEAGLPAEALEAMVASEVGELQEELKGYRAVRPQGPIGDRVVILVDDGLTTGASALAAARVASKRGAAQVIVAVPVSSQEAAESLAPEVGAVVCLETPPLLLALGEWYEDFTEVSDAQVMSVLSDAART